MFALPTKKYWPTYFKYIMIMCMLVMSVHIDILVHWAFLVVHMTAYDMRKHLTSKCGQSHWTHTTLRADANVYSPLKSWPGRGNTPMISVRVRRSTGAKSFMSEAAKERVRNCDSLPMVRRLQLRLGSSSTLHISTPHWMEIVAHARPFRTLECVHQIEDVCQWFHLTLISKDCVFPDHCSDTANWYLCVFFWALKSLNSTRYFVLSFCC